MSKADTPLKIAIAGLGHVGANFVKQIEALNAQEKRYEVVGVCARDKDKNRGFDLSTYDFFTDPLEMLNAQKPDLYVELMGGAEGVAKASVEHALQNGIACVSANKALIATHALTLAKLSEDNGARFFYEAAVAGSIPVIATLTALSRTDQIKTISGILNGTCNFILSKMEAESCAYEEALKQAQDLGYAEADPHFDVAGLDAGFKIRILALLAFGRIFDGEIYCEGVDAVTSSAMKHAKEQGYKIRLLGQANHTGSIVVAPFLVPQSHPLAGITGPTNAVTLECLNAGPQTLIGAGAGGQATAAAVLTDIERVRRAESKPEAFNHAHSQIQTLKPTVPEMQTLCIDGKDYPVYK